eukprot:s2636_g2.t1
MFIASWQDSQSLLQSPEKKADQKCAAQSRQHVQRPWSSWQSWSRRETTTPGPEAKQKSKRALGQGRRFFGRHGTGGPAMGNLYGWDVIGFYG